MCHASESRALVAVPRQITSCIIRIHQVAVCARLARVAPASARCRHLRQAAAVGRRASVGDTPAPTPSVRCARSGRARRDSPPLAGYGVTGGHLQWRHVCASQGERQVVRQFIRVEAEFRDVLQCCVHVHAAQQADGHQVARTLSAPHAGASDRRICRSSSQDASLPSGWRLRTITGRIVDPGWQVKPALQCR